MIRKAAVQIGIPALLAFMAWNAYLVVNHLKLMQNISSLTLESSAIQADLSTVLRDLTNMETGQRGFLLTGNSAYLQPYTDARNKLETDFSHLRQGLAHRSSDAQTAESQLESVAKSKQAEMERSITLRQQGYRHRAFMLVDTGEGKGEMDQIRGIVSTLFSAESDNFARLDAERGIALKKLLSTTLLVNAAMFMLAAFLFVLIRHIWRLLREEASQSRKELTVRDSKLERLTSALSGPARSNITAINTNSRLLLENYGGFLPRQGQEYAEQMKEAAAQMELLRQDLVDGGNSKEDEKAA
jgi:CHASE3 domain sensor protein